MAIDKPKNYWDNKFWAYMHDPFDKAFDIKTHVQRANELCEIFGIEQPNEEFWKKADGIASGFERGQITSYNKNDEKSGAVDFINNPILSHPTGENAQLKINLNNFDKEKLFIELKEFMGKEIGVEAGKGGYSDEFKGNNEKFKIARFLYTHLVLRFRLANENVGNIGALWHRLPADTRFPDHSIWQHNALVSAIQSCFDIAGNKNDIGLMLFSITPVQSFISKARKLRDFWSGSVLLSWLAFEGIKWVIENLGPDHILYPSLVDQYLVNKYLTENWHVKPDVLLNNEPSIANFPNKFLFLIPINKADDIAKEIESDILKAWKDLYAMTANIICQKLNVNNEESKFINEMFKRQNDDYWNIQWVAVNLLKKDNENDIRKLLPPVSYENQFKLLNKFLSMIEDKNYEKSGIGTLYSVSNSLIQSALAAQKNCTPLKTKNEPGEKCQLCGEFEVLHSKEYKQDISANDYKKNITDFWQELKSKFDGENGVDFKENERLCSICLIKRLAYRVIKSNSNHILNETFKISDNFPSTTYFSLYNYFKRKNITDEKEKIKEADKQHEKTETKTKDIYYAILLMDGDKIGKLINGESIASTWQSVMHPEIYEKLQNGTIDEVYSKNWQEIFADTKLNKRNITPAVHAAISESLGDFAVYGVAQIIRKYEGRLIYAGGDDVCAILPAVNAISAAKEIATYYKSSFKLIKNKNEIIDITNEFVPQPGKLSINLGKGDDISISAGVLICHHKASLSHMIKEAHMLLDNKAKEEGGRNAIAIQLKKRSGGDRFFITKFDSDKLNNFIELSNSIGEEMSRSLAYRLSMLKDGIDAILKSEDKQDLLFKFILKQVKRSGTISNNDEKIANKICDVIIDNKGRFSNEPLIIAGFLNQKEDKEESNV